ncbi:MAG TPA: DCC1-like thiol-disulfide oxidoreductase family protein [Acidobacteriota bacterium]|nr:DCC1-like thiol-disulfide oxidoreductase family protein [Acidobacteriota bacterium]
MDKQAPRNDSLWRGKERPVILFDGVCNLCAWSVQFVLKRDREGVFRFASLQSDVAPEILDGCRFDEDDLDSVVLVDRDGCWARSAAALRIARRLRFPWPLLYAFVIVPRPLRDLLYRFIARNRYRWFGRKEQCWLPDDNWKQRFLDSE